MVPRNEPILDESSYAQSSTVSSNSGMNVSPRYSLHILIELSIRNNVILDAVDLETPPYERDSTGMWVDIPKNILQMFYAKGRNPAEGIHSAQHAVLSLTPLYSMSTSKDIRTECKVAAKEELARESSRKRPGRLVLCCRCRDQVLNVFNRLIFYDAAGSGGGVCAKAFDHSMCLFWNLSVLF